MVKKRIQYANAGTVPPVFLAGSFTEWKPSIEMQYEAAGQNASTDYRFSTDVELEPGVHQYKFRLGMGDWWVVDNTVTTATDDSGNVNNVLVVEEAPVEPVAPLKEEPEVNYVNGTDRKMPPLIEKPAAVEEKPALLEEKPAPIEEKPAPIEEKPAPIEEKHEEPPVIVTSTDPKISKSSSITGSTTVEEDQSDHKSIPVAEKATAEEKPKIVSVPKESKPNQAEKSKKQAKQPRTPFWKGLFGCFTQNPAVSLVVAAGVVAAAWSMQKYSMASVSGF